LVKKKKEVDSDEAEDLKPAIKVKESGKTAKLVTD